MSLRSHLPLFFFFNDTATTEIYTLSLHDALPICSLALGAGGSLSPTGAMTLGVGTTLDLDRKSTRLNSSHSQISYAVFCLKKKKIKHDVAVNPLATHILDTSSRLHALLCCICKSR